jgi:hypothetical protein
MIGLFGGITYWWSARRRGLTQFPLSVAIDLQEG